MKLTLQSMRLVGQETVSLSERWLNDCIGWCHLNESFVAAYSISVPGHVKLRAEDLVDASILRI